MTRQTKIKLAVLLPLLVVCVCYYSGIFATREIPVQAIVYDPRNATSEMLERRFNAAAPVTFALGKSPVTSIRLDKLDDGGNDSHEPPLWHLVAENPKDPPILTGFAYGQQIRGLRPDASLPDQPQSLEWGTQYRLTVQTTRYRGSVNFKTLPYPGNTP